MEIIFPPGREPVRLDRFLAEEGVLPSRAFGQRLIREGRVRVNGEKARASRRLLPRDRVTLEIPPPEPSHLVPEEIPLDVRFEDGDLVVVNKAPGMVVHPGAGVRTGTLVHALLHHCGSLSGAGDPMRPGVIHRLDKETSGLLIVAKNAEAHARLAAAMERREVERSYTAVVWGRMPDEGTIDAPIGRSDKDRKKMAVVHGGRRAISRFVTEERFRYASSVTVRLETGRTHQIRVHFSHKGHPVFGDGTYGGRRKALLGIAPEHRRSAAEGLRTIGRQALHARTLRFRHPRTGDGISVEAPPPEDMKNLLGFLREDLGA